MKVHQAAILANGKVYTLPRPARHGCVMRWMREHDIDERPDEQQGFVLDDGRFVSRKAAASVALKTGQTEKLKWPPSLYSEDLW